MQKIITFIAAIFITIAANAQQAPQKDLNVAMRLVSPFVFEEKGKLTGFSVELWENLARNMNRKYVALPKTTLADTFSDVKSGKADLAIAAISITAEREATYDFSLPMFDSGLQIMVSSDNASNALSPLKNLAKLLGSKNMLQMLGLLLLLMFLPVPILYMIEKRNDDLLPSKTFVGKIIDSLWWSASTLGAQSTHMPKSNAGRLLGVIWMFTAILFVSFFTASFAAGLTVQSLEGTISEPKHLVGKKVATVKNSTSAKYLRSIGNIELVEFEKIEETYALLTTNQVVAVVYDAPILLYYAKNEGKDLVSVVGSIFNKENYGILFAENNPLRKDVNAALLKFRESGEYLKLYEKWFGKEDEDE